MPQTDAGIERVSMSTDGTDTPRAGDSTFKSPREIAFDEIFWYHVLSAAEVGEHSAWESLITAALTGGSRGVRLEHWTSVSGAEGEVTMPAPPPRQIRAAARQSRIRSALGHLPAAMRALLAHVVTPKENTQLNGLFGREIGPVVRYLIDSKQLKINFAADGEEKRRIEQLAQGRLDEALDAYIDAKIATARARHSEARRIARPAVAAE